MAPPTKDMKRSPAQDRIAAKTSRRISLDTQVIGGADDPSASQLGDGYDVESQVMEVEASQQLETQDYGATSKHDVQSCSWGDRPHGI